MISLPLLLALALRSDPVPTPVPSETGSAAAGPAGLSVTWAHTYPEAIESAKQIPGGRILVELTEPGCGECERQEALIVPSTSFYTFMRDKVPVRVGFSSPEGQKLVERWGIPSPPAWIVLTPEGLLCGVQQGAVSQGLWFETFVKTEQSWADYRKRLEEEKKSPGDPVLVFAVAEETYRRGGDELAEARFRRVAGSSQASASLREKSLAYLASIELDQKRIVEAERELRALLTIGSDPALRERAELRLADVEIAKGRKDKAVALLRQFRRDHPGSALVAEADELLKALGSPAEAAEGASK